MGATLRGRCDGVVAASSSNRANREPIWRAAPRRQHQESKSALLYCYHVPLRQLHMYHQSPCSLQTSDCVPVWSRERTLTLGHYAPNGRAASIVAAACKLLSGAADAAPKTGLQIEPKSVPHNGSTNGWWNRNRGQILASIGGLIFDDPKLVPQRGGHATSAEHAQPLNPIMLIPTSPASEHGFRALNQHLCHTTVPQTVMEPQPCPCAQGALAVNRCE